MEAVIISKNTRQVDFTKKNIQPMKINCQTEFNEVFFYFTSNAL